MRKKIRWIKRGLAVMLSVCMVFGVAPIQAGAEENDSEIAVQTNDSAGKTEQQSTEEEECKHEGVEITFNSNGFGNCPKLVINRFSSSGLNSPFRRAISIT